MVDLRLPRVNEVASRLFIKQGYARTQIDQIVRESGVSVGAMYDLFSGKKAIFDFTLKCALDPQFLVAELALPLGEAHFSELDDEAVALFDSILQNLVDPAEALAEGYSYERMLGDSFDLYARYRVGCLLLEANLDVRKRVARRYEMLRREIYSNIAQLVDVYIAAGILRETRDPEAFAKYIVESLFWWAMQIHYDPFGENENLSDDTARAICLDALRHAFLRRP